MKIKRKRKEPKDTINEKDVQSWATTQYGNGGSSIDSLRHQAGKTMDYEFYRGSANGTGLSNYGNPKLNNPTKGDAVDWYMENIAPQLGMFQSAMEKGEAGDFLYNSGKDVRPYAIQEHLKQIDPNNSQNWQDAGGKYKDRKDSTKWDGYWGDIQKLPENQRRQLINKGRDFYYKNINNPSPGVPNDAYDKTWYGRIWNTNDYKEFDPNNPKFIPKKQNGGSIKKYPNGGRQPIVGTPRQYQAYQDSLDRFNWANNRAIDYTGMKSKFVTLDQYKKEVPKDFQLDLSIEKDIMPAGFNYYKDIDKYSAIYKKPVQPIIYQPEDVVKKITRDLRARPSEPTEYRPLEQPINIQSAKPDLLQGNNQQLEFNPLPFDKSKAFSKPISNQNESISKEDMNKKDYFDKKTGKPLGRFQNGGKNVNTLEGDLYSKVLMNRNKNLDFVQRANAVGQFPKSNMFQQFDPNEFGQKNSHLMGWGEDENGQAYMSPSIFNDKNEAIKVPNQYADYISSIGYKHATGIPTKQNGGSINEIQKYNPPQVNNELVTQRQYVQGELDNKGYFGYGGSVSYKDFKKKYKDV